MKHRILLVEDENIVAMDIKQRLEKMGYVISGLASSGEQAIQKAEKENPDLVLMDIKLKGEIDGIQAAEIIRQRLHLPVIFLTAFADEATLERARITEAYGYILKPFEERELATTIGIAIYKHQMESKLRDSEKHYRLIAENTDDVIWTYDILLKRMTFVSPSVVKQCGYSVVEVMSLRIEDLLSPETYLYINEEFPRRLAAFNAGDKNVKVRTEQLDLIHKNDSMIHLEAVTTLLTDQDNQVTGVLGVTRDITLRKQAEEALRASEERERLKARELEAVLEAVPVPVLITTDRECKYMTGNQAAYELIRIPRNANPSINESNDERPTFRMMQNGIEILPENMPMKLAAANGVVASAVPLTFQYEDGTEIEILGSAVPLLDANGQPMGAVGAYVDITEQKRAERKIRDLNRTLEQRVLERTAHIELTNTQLKEMSYSIAHTLRAPLRAINGYSYVLSKNYAKLMDAQGTDYLNRIGEASVSMSQMIDGLLGLLKVTSKKIEVSQVDLSLLAQSIIEELKHTYPERVVEFICPPGLVVQADEMMMNMLVNQLVGNAWEYTRNCPLAKIEIGNDKQEGQDVFFIRDNGIGFDIAYKDQLFGLFQQLHPNSEYEGVGIGLAIVQRIIQRHGGKIWAEGEVGLGARISFTIP